MTRSYWNKIFWGLIVAVMYIKSVCAMTVSDLQQLLQSAPATIVSFQEVHESPWLESPARSSGTMRFTSSMLEKHVQLPREKTWRLYSDHAEWIGAGGIGHKQISFDKAPQLGLLANALRGVVSGHIQPLEKAFIVTINGTRKRWSAKLKPRGKTGNQQLISIDFSGQNSWVTTIVVYEQGYEQTTIHLLH